MLLLQQEYKRNIEHSYRRRRTHKNGHNIQKTKQYFDKTDFLTPEENLPTKYHKLCWTTE